MEKNTLAAIISAVAIFAFFALVLPQYDAIKAIREAINSRQVILNERTAESSNVRDLDGEVKSRQSDINKIKSFLPERKQVDGLVSSIQNMVESSGVQLVGMTVGDVASNEETRFKKMLIGIDVASPYPSFVDFLKLIEQSLRLYDVNEVNAAASTTLPGIVNFSIKMNAYYLK